MSKKNTGILSPAQRRETNQVKFSEFDVTQIHDDVHLTNFALAIWNKADSFIANRIFPNLPVSIPTGEIMNFGVQGMSIVDTKKGTYSELNKVRFKVKESDRFLLEDHGLWDDVFAAEYKRFGNGKLKDKLDEIKTKNILQLMLLAKEYQCLRSFSSDVISNYTVLASPAKWNNTGSDPIADIRNLITSVEDECGQKPNALVIAPDVINKLCDNAQIRARITGIVTSVGEGTVLDILKKEFSINEILVPRAKTYDEDSSEFEKLFFNKVAALVIDDTPSGWEKNTFGYTFTDEGTFKTYKLTGLAGQPQGFLNGQETMIKIVDSRDIKILNEKCAGVLDGVLATS